MMKLKVPYLLKAAKKLEASGEEGPANRALRNLRQQVSSLELLLQSKHASYQSGHKSWGAQAPSAMRSKQLYLDLSECRTP